MPLPPVAFTNPFIGKALGVHPNGDGTFTYQGQIIDKYQNVWDPGTSGWYNPQGQQWVGTNIGSGQGVFNDTPTIRGTNGKIYGGGGLDPTGGFDPSGLGGGGGGGGGSGPDHFFDITPYQQGQLDIQGKQFQLDQQAFDWKKIQDGITNTYNQLKNDRDNALAIGDLELAKQKQASMDYWQGQGNKIAVQTSNASNATDIAKSQIAAGSTLQNTKINDDTTRATAGMQGQIQGYNAATTRGKDMGQLALDNNKFILDKSTSPRDLFGLYMMQRGITPDWGSLTNGGAPVMGDPLKTRDPFSFLDTSQHLPTNYTIAPGAAYNSSTSTMTPGQNGIMSIPQIEVPSGPMPTQYNDINPGGLQGGVPTAGLRPGMNLSTYGGSTPGTGSMFDTGTAYYDQGRTRPIGSNDVINPGSQVWVDYGGGASRPNMRDLVSHATPETTGPNQLQNGGQQWRFANGTNSWADFGMQPNDYAPAPGYTNATKLMTGDATSPNPWDGGAKPESIENPTGAPLRIKNTYQTMADYGQQAQVPDSFMPKQPLTAPTMFPAMQPQISQPMPIPAPQPTPYMQQPSMVQTPMLADYGYRPQIQPIAVNQSSGMQAWTPRYANGTDSENTLAQLLARVLEHGIFNVGGAVSHGSPQVGGLAGQNMNGVLQDAGASISNAAGMVLPPDTTGDYAPRWAQEDMLNRMRGLGGNPDFPVHIPPTRWNGPSNINPDIPLDPSQINDQRYALGTDVSSNYQQNGMGDQYLQSSSNPGVNRGMLPRNMQTLYDYGIPLAPSLIAGTTGQAVGQANLGSAFNQRGGGVLTSLQGMRNMSPGEQDLYSGYAQGVTGIPWADIADYLGKPTQNLGQAKRAGMVGF